MAGRRVAAVRWLLPVLGGVLFLLVFLLALSLTLPGESVLSIARPSLAKAGIEVAAEEVRLVFPLSVRMRNAQVRYRGAEPLALDTVKASFEPSGLFRWLPFRVAAGKGEAAAEIRTSPAFWNPGTIHLRASRIDRDALSPPLSRGSAADFALESGEARWKLGPGGEIAGSGTLRFSRLRVPIPSRESPVREAEIRDAEIRFAVRGGTVHVPSFTGTYEDARVEGTGEIARVFDPAASTVTFHLTIVNPLEGKVAGLFDLVAKNAKNGTLRITGTLLAPQGEFRFF